MKLSRALRDPNLLVVALMGFSSGLPLLLLGSTLKAWLTEEKVNLATVGLFALTGLPYTWKFIWAPIMDRFTPPLGRRRGWLLISQAGVIAAILGLSFVTAGSNLKAVAFFAFLLAFFSASQDIVVDAYRREILPDAELGIGSSLFVNGYRVAMLCAGAGALFLADHVPWPQVYQIMAATMAVGMLTALFCKEPKLKTAPPKSLKDSVIGPLKEFFTRDSAWIVLAFVLLYKIAESMASDMYTPFFLSLAFTKSEIATMSKLFGFWATIAGGFAGGLIIVRMNIFRALALFGALQAVALLQFAYLAKTGHDLTLLGVSITTEYFTSGMATTAYVAFMASQTNKKFTATQYALLSSLMGVPRAIFGATTGWLALTLGWAGFFIFCAAFAVPGLLILIPLQRRIKMEA